MLVEYFRCYNLTQHNAQLDVKLEHPVSRFDMVIDIKAYSSHLLCSFFLLYYMYAITSTLFFSLVYIQLKF